MHKPFFVLCLFAATLCCAASSADEPSDALSARIDKLVREKMSEMWLGHDFSDPQVERMRKQLSRVSFPAKDGTVAKTLGIADPAFFVVFRGCRFSFLDDFDECGWTLTREVCRLNKGYELVVIRETAFFRDHREPKTTEISAEIRRIERPN